MGSLNSEGLRDQGWGSARYLARMVTLRATSMPARSSRGSGSVKPCALAWDTTSEKALPATKLLKM